MNNVTKQCSAMAVAQRLSGQEVTGVPGLCGQQNSQMTLLRLTTAGKVPPVRSPRGGIGVEDLPDGEVLARNRRVCKTFSSLNLDGLLLLCYKWRQMAIRVASDTKEAGKYHGDMAADEKFQEITQVLATAIASRKMDGASSLNQFIRRPDDDRLDNAFVTLDGLEAQLRAEACQLDVLGTSGVVEDDVAAPDSESQKSNTIPVAAPSTACHAELEMPTGTLTVFLTRFGGFSPKVGSTTVEGQQLDILLAGFVADSQRRPQFDEDEETPTGTPSGNRPIFLEWTNDSLQKHVRSRTSAAIPAALRAAIANVRGLVKFQDGVGLVTPWDKKTGIRRSTIPFRLL